MLATAGCYQEAVNQLDDQHGRNAVEMYCHKTCHRNNTRKPNQTTSVLFEDTYKRLRNFVMYFASQYFSQKKKQRRPN